MTECKPLEGLVQHWMLNAKTVYGEYLTKGQMKQYLDHIGVDNAYYCRIWQSYPCPLLDKYFTRRSEQNECVRDAKEL